MAAIPPHHLRALVVPKPDPARRRRPHRPFLDRIGHQARARGCDQARRGAQPAGARARGGLVRISGGAGLLYTEMTCVSPEGRITPGCTGMYAPGHVAAWKRIVDFVHANGRAGFCLQLGHSGPKGSTKLGWEGYDVPLESGNWPVMAA